MVSARITVTVPRGHQITIDGMALHTDAPAIETTIVCETDGGAPITIGLVDAEVPGHAR